jgi:hypothetical protein
MAEPESKPEPTPGAAPGSTDGAPRSAAMGAPHGETTEGVGLIATKKEFIKTFFARAEEFIETLLKENGKLRYQVLELQARLTAVGAPVDPGDAVTDLVTRIEALEAEREQMLARFRAVQRDNLDFEERSREIERENNNLANLYVASYQLHSTLDLREVTQIILEILLNFIGARTFAIVLVDESRGVLVPLAAEGIPRDRIPFVPVGKGAIGAVVTTGKALVDTVARAGSAGGSVELERPLIVSPLRIKEKVVGAIVIWEFLPQKTELADVDHELLNLLAAHAASALTSATLSADLGGRSPALWGAVDLV